MILTLKRVKLLIAASVAYLVGYFLQIGNEFALILPFLGNMDDFGEQFAAKTVRRIWQNAVFPSITNNMYEGEIKKAGDRVNLLSFPGVAQLEDYVAGTDMGTNRVFDLEDQLTVEKRKSHSFAIDRLEDLFTYVDDAQDNLIENVAMEVERTIDSYVLEFAQFAKAGSWVGIDIRVAGSSADTHASISTSATGGTLSVQGAPANGGQVGTIEHGDGTLDYFGFEDPQDVGKPIRLTSGTTWATEWYRITGVTDSQTVSIENWDGATEAWDIPNGDILRGLGGGFLYTGGAANQDGKPTTEVGWGWEYQSGRATSIASGTIYEQLVALAEKLDENEIPDTDRHLTVTPAIVGILKNASEVIPAIQMAYEGVVINGRVGRAGGFDIHSAAGARLSTRLEKSTSSGQGADVSLSDGSRATQVLANHTSYCTFAYKWAESRVVDAEDQFAKKYQALHLFGAQVPGIRRRAGAMLFGTI